MSALRRNQRIVPYLFISPFFILFLVFGLYPITYSIYISFFRWGLTGLNKQFIGLTNYVNLLTIDPFFGKSLLNTLILLVTGSLLQHFFAIPLAILLNNKFLKYRHLFRATYFLPFITSTISVVIIFSQFFDQNAGWINYILTEWLGLKAVAWTEDPVAIKAALSIILNWKYIGWNTIIYLAGLQNIPASLYEVSRIDGANTFKQHVHITLPLLLPIIFFTVTLSIIGGMQIVDEIYVLLGGFEGLGGNQQSGLTTAFFLMYTAFFAGRLGKGAAMAWLLFVIIIGLTLINRFVTSRLESRY